MPGKPPKGSFEGVWETLLTWPTSPIIFGALYFRMLFLGCSKEDMRAYISFSQNICHLSPNRS